MSSPPPTKPPRGVKQGKETSGLLMSVIRTLSASETNEQREKERAKLEKEYKKSDARLDDLVAAHAQEITEVMQKFSSVGAALSAWGAHSAAAVARLAACRALLRLRRADLRRLWADARAHHHALRMLADIERVVVSERACRELAAAGRVLAAAHALQAALRTRCTQLPHVRALSATADNLQAMKLELVEQIVRRLSDAVYRSERSPLPRRPSARRTAALLLAELTKSEEVTDAYLQDITPEYEASLSEEDKTFESTVMISLEALGVLEQLREATEKFKVQIQTELLEVIESVSHRIIEEGDAEAGPEPDGEPEADDVDDDGEMPGADGAADSGRALVRLVACLADEFRACGARHKRLLQLWRAALQRHGLPDAALHTEHHYWSAVQQVLQLLLTEYLEIESVTLAAQRAGGPPADPQPDLRLADYFAKKRPPRRRAKLFRLAAEAPSSPGGARRQRYPLVCRPRPALLYAALPALQPLCAHIESLPGGGECSLRAFVSDYVRWGESERLAQEARAAVEAAARASAACRERTTVGAHAVSVCAAQWWAAVRACAAIAAQLPRGAVGGQFRAVAAGAEAGVRARGRDPWRKPGRRRGGAPGGRGRRGRARGRRAAVRERGLAEQQRAHAAGCGGLRAQALRRVPRRGGLCRRRLGGHLPQVPAVLAPRDAHRVLPLPGAGGALRVCCGHSWRRGSGRVGRRCTTGRGPARLPRARRSRAGAPASRVRDERAGRDDVSGAGVALAERTRRARAAGSGRAAGGAAPLPGRAAAAARRPSCRARLPTPVGLHARGDHNVGAREGPAVLRTGVPERVQGDRRAARRERGRHARAPAATGRCARARRRHRLNAPPPPHTAPPPLIMLSAIFKYSNTAPASIFCIL